MKWILSSRPVMVLVVGVASVAAMLLTLGCFHRGDESGPVPVVATPPGPSPSPSRETTCPIQLREVTAKTGISFVHTDGSSGRHFIVESMTAGLATLDYDSDGLWDLYFPNGAPLPGTHVNSPPRHALYRNLGNWEFQEVTDAACVVSHAYGMGAAVGDYDNDGFPDIYVSDFGPNILYHNNGDGTFSDVTKEAGVFGSVLVGAGVAFLDIEGDGDLDLYAGNYLELDPDSDFTRRRNGVPVYPSPQDYTPVLPTLYQNNGDGTFSDISLESGVGAKGGRCMGMTCADYDDDGDTDVFVCNDVLENFLFRNDGHGRFEEVGWLVGVAFSGDGEILANMGVDCGDADRDGYLDFFTTNYQNQSPVLFRNLHDGFFEDVARKTKAGQGGFNYVNWGCGFADFDNDGYLDLFFANGHTEDTLAQLGEGDQAARNVVLHNNGHGSFEDVSQQCGDGLLPKLVSRGIALDDLDNDGGIDVVVVNSRDRPTVVRNVAVELGTAGHWLQVQLRGVKANRDGVGARVEVVSGDLRMVDEVHSGRGYQSHWGSVIHFGLGDRDRVDRITVRWVGGGRSQFEDVGVDQRVILIEGRESIERLAGEHD